MGGAPGPKEGFVSAVEKSYHGSTARGAARMVQYRLYCLDGAGRIERAEEITATGDAEAIMIAEAMKKPMKCELWERSRMVATLEPYRG